MNRLATHLVLLVCTLSFACAEGGEMPCRFGSDCASGVCLIDGICEPLADGALPIVDAGAARDAGVAAPDSGALDAGAPSADAGRPDAASCGDGDSRIELAELPLDLGGALTMSTASNVAIDSHGVERSGGARLWDYEGPFAGESTVTLRREPLGAAWYAASFTGGSYTLPLTSEADLLGVFERTGDSVRLLGVVSPEAGLARTELTYDPPVTVWRFPLEVGAEWSETSSVSGLASGVASLYTEAWSVTVDARGDVGLPAGVRPVLRVNTEIVRTVGVVTTVSRRHSYIQECVGAVAQIFSLDNELEAEPSFAAELWRLTP